jgi:hypothetical protein
MVVLFGIKAHPSVERLGEQTFRTNIVLLIDKVYRPDHMFSFDKS